MNDNPSPADTLSAEAAQAVCAFHIEDDDEVPTSLKDRLRELIQKERFAEGVLYCFDAIWDRGFESEFPPSERKYTP